MTADVRGGDAGGGRRLGFWSATALVVASMLGTGVFTTSGFLLADLKSPVAVLAAWLLGGVVALFGALSYGALARHIPESGGEYVFLSRTLHPAAGYVAGWISLLVGFSAPLAAAAHAFGRYTADWFPGVPPTVIGTGVLVAASLAHAWDVRGGAALQNAVVLVKAVLLVALIGLGLGRIESWPAAGPDAVPVPAFAMALVWVSFSYAGWNAVIYVGGEVANPGRTIPRALLAGALIVTLLYLALNAVFVLAVPGEAIAGQLEVGRIVAARLGGPAWAEAATVAVVLALLTSVSALAMSGPRVYARIAADGFLPAWLRMRGDGPPRGAIGFQLVLALLLLWTAGYTALLTFIGFTLGISTAATVVGLMRERRRLGAALPVPGWPWVQGFFVAAVLGTTLLSMSRAPGPSAAGLGVLAIGWAAWAWQARHQRRSPAASDPTAEGP